MGASSLILSGAYQWNRRKGSNSYFVLRSTALFFDERPEDRNGCVPIWKARGPKLLVTFYEGSVLPHGDAGHE